MSEQRSSDGGFREALDSLIHRGGPPRPPVMPTGGSPPAPFDGAPAETAVPPPVASARPVDPPILPATWPALPIAATGPSDRRGTGPLRWPLPRGAADATTGLYDTMAWQALLAREEARWIRYRERCLLIQVEIAGIDRAAHQLGEAAAERLLVALAETLREETRASDLYARVSRWRIQGVLADEGGHGGAPYTARVRDRLTDRLDGLPFRLLVGMAGPGRDGFQGALTRAASRMHAPPPRSASDAIAGGMAAVGRIGPAMTVLEGLRAGGLITAEEHERKRAELLERL